ncbi:DUF58 domain-containing protein [Rossellomorea marisflavi]|uniref:DUF58 domain-containing protein n=1 Tax=Rossellomorea marisflavi TaxID=189381 RepID=UPI00345CCBE2
MKWKRDIGEDPYLNMSTMLLVIMLAGSLFVQSYIASGVLILCIVYVRVHRWFLLKAGEGVKLDSTPKKVRMHEGEEAEWMLGFRNDGLPVWGATLKLKFKDIVEPASKQMRFDVTSGVVEASVPFSAGKGERVEISIPVIGKRRGLCRITSMELYIPHLFGSGRTVLQLMDPIPSTLMVFPRSTPVVVEEHPISMRFGDVFTPHSLYSDPFQIVGTRGYVAGDRFQDIHWKASARTGDLQTKQFAPSTQKEWLIAINLSDRYAITGRLESIVSQAAYMMQLAVKGDIPFSMVINTRGPGATPYFHLPSGAGKPHMQRGLELLSALSTDDFTMPFELVLQHMRSRQWLPPVIFLAGELNQEIERVLTQIASGGTQILKLTTLNEQGVASRWNMKSDPRQPISKSS